MFVKEHMTQNPVTITPDTSVPEALHIMRENNVRRLPILDRHGKLVGIVSDKALLHASPSPATSLAVWEITELHAKLKVESVMSRDVVTVPEDTLLEEAARIMVDSEVGGLPVMRGDALVGIITESDLFKVLLELLGGRRNGLRLTVSATGTKGTLAKIATAIFDIGGNIVGLGVSEIKDVRPNQWEIMLKVQDVHKDPLVQVVQPVVNEIIDVRET
ncbi:MAG: CBS domain-containing protein [Anaerolineales bacterium]|jgi:acetoin utilization protein AcuB